MSDLYMIVYSTMADGSFTVSSNIRPEKHAEIIGEFLRTQIGAGGDNREPADRPVYQIRLDVDLGDDSFRVSDNCGNKALRDGILLDVMRRLNSPVPKEDPVANLTTISSFSGEVDVPDGFAVARAGNAMVGVTIVAPHIALAYKLAEVLLYHEVHFELKARGGQVDISAPEASVAGAFAHMARGDYP